MRQKHAKARLDAIPYTALCVKCAAKAKTGVPFESQGSLREHN